MLHMSKNPGFPLACTNTESTQVVGGGGGAGKVVPPYAVSEEDSERDRATPAG